MQPASGMSVSHGCVSSTHRPLTISPHYRWTRRQQHHAQSQLGLQRVRPDVFSASISVVAFAAATCGVKAVSHRHRRWRDCNSAWLCGSPAAPRAQRGSVSVLVGGSDLELAETSLELSAAFGVSSVSTLATLATAVFFHESGHFLCAKTVNLPAAEFSIGFGPEVFTTAEERPPGSPDEVTEFKDAQNDLVRLERFSSTISIVVNDKQVWKGIPTFDSSSKTLDCGGQGTCEVSDDVLDEVKNTLQKATDNQLKDLETPVDTIFSLRVLPIGGFVRFDERKTVKLQDGTMITALDSMSVSAQLWVYAGGVVTNMVVAFATLSAAALTTGVPDKKALPGILVSRLGEDDVLRTGLRSKDVLLQIGDLDLHASGQSVGATVDFIHRLPAKQPVSVLVDRAGQEFRLDIVPLSDISTGFQRLGVQILTNTERVFLKSTDVFEAAGIAVANIQQQLGEQITVLKSVLSASSASGELVGPVGIIQQGSQLADAEGLIGLATFFVTVNLNLALLNVLPIPGLDGGKIAFAIAGKVLGKPLDEEAKQNVEGVFIALVLLLLAGLTLKDVTKLFQP